MYIVKLQQKSSLNGERKSKWIWKGVQNIQNSMETSSCQTFSNWISLILLFHSTNAIQVTHLGVCSPQPIGLTCEFDSDQLLTSSH